MIADTGPGSLSHKTFHFSHCSRGSDSPTLSCSIRGRSMDTPTSACTPRCSAPLASQFPSSYFLQLLRTAGTQEHKERRCPCRDVTGRCQWCPVSPLPLLQGTAGDPGCGRTGPQPGQAAGEHSLICSQAFTQRREGRRSHPHFM